MQPLAILRFIGSKTEGTLLDLGCGDCRLAKKFVETGFIVDAIDSTPQPTCEAQDITFVQKSAEDFDTEKVYDLVLAWNLLWFTRWEPKEAIEKLLSFTTTGGTVLCNFLLEEDSWKDRDNVTTTTKGIVLKACADVGGKIAFQGEVLYDGLDRKNNEKKWHIFAVAIKKA